MTGRFTALLLLATLVAFGPPAPAGAQPVGEVFRKELEGHEAAE